MKNYLQYRLHKIYACFAFVAPLAALFGINHEAYISTSQGGTAIAFWGYVVMFFAAIGFKNKIADFTKKKTVLSISIGIFIAALIMRFLADQLMLISGATIAGSLLSEAFEPVAQVYYDRCFKQISAEQRIKIKTEYLSPKLAWKQAYSGLEM